MAVSGILPFLMCLTLTPFPKERAPKSVTMNLWITCIKIILCFINFRRAMLCVLYHGLLRNSFIVIEKSMSHVLFFNLLLELCALLAETVPRHTEEEQGEEWLGSSWSWRVWAFRTNVAGQELTRKSTQKSTLLFGVHRLHINYLGIQLNSANK